MTITYCTWHTGRQYCDIRATHPYLNSQGVMWANLCGTHSLTLDSAIASGDPKALLSAWVKASGGAKKLASEFGSATREPTGELLMSGEEK